MGMGKESQPAPFGACRPVAWQRAVAAVTRRLPEGWLGARLYNLLREPVIRLSPGPLDVEALGLRLRLHLGDNSTERRLFFRTEQFDPFERAFLAERAHPGFVFLDIGANIGIYSLLVAKLAGPDARILAFEPNPAAAERLAFNIAANGFSAIELLPLAVSDRDGEIELAVHAGNMGRTTILSTPAASDVTRLAVPTRRLAGLCREKGIARIDAMKLDVEGAEDVILTNVLAEAPETLWPAAVIIERSVRRWQRADCIALLEAHGYRVLARTRGNVVLGRGG